MTIAFSSHPSARPLLAPSTSYTASINLVIIPRQVMTFSLPSKSAAAPVASSSSYRESLASSERQRFPLERIRGEEVYSRVQQGIETLVRRVVSPRAVWVAKVEVRAQRRLRIVSDRVVLARANEELARWRVGERGEVQRELKRGRRRAGRSVVGRRVHCDGRERRRGSASVFKGMWTIRGCRVLRFSRRSSECGKGSGRRGGLSSGSGTRWRRIPSGPLAGWLNCLIRLTCTHRVDERLR